MYTLRETNGIALQHTNEPWDGVWTRGEIDGSAWAYGQFKGILSDKTGMISEPGTCYILASVPKCTVICYNHFKQHGLPYREWIELWKELSAVCNQAKGKIPSEWD